MIELHGNTADGTPSTLVRALARNLGFNSRELRDIERVVTERQQRLREAWDAYFRS